MTRSIGYCSLICAAAIVVALSVWQPSFLSDRNDFLNKFVTHELLGLLGIIMTITLASAANLHLEFNKIEERYKKRGLTKTRQGVKQGAFCLIGLFFLSVFLVVTKSALAQNEIMQSLFNGSALIIVLWNVLILIDVTELAFAIEPNVDD